MAHSKLNSKSISRIAAIQILYQFENDSYKGEDDIDTLLLRIMDFYKNEDVKSDHDISSKSKLKLRPSYNYLKELVNTTHNNIDEIDKIIEQHLTKAWTLKNLPKLLYATLRVAISEIKFFPEIPRKVILNEYTDIAANMLDDKEVGFVNSVLDKFANVATDSA